MDRVGTQKLGFGFLEVAVEKWGLDHQRLFFITQVGKGSSEGKKYQRILTSKFVMGIFM